MSSIIKIQPHGGKILSADEVPELADDSVELGINVQSVGSYSDGEDHCGGADNVAIETLDDATRRMDGDIEPSVYDEGTWLLWTAQQSIVEIGKETDGRMKL